MVMYDNENDNYLTKDKIELQHKERKIKELVGYSPYTKRKHCITILWRKNKKTRHQIYTQRKSFLILQRMIDILGSIK